MSFEDNSYGGSPLVVAWLRVREVIELRLVASYHTDQSAQATASGSSCGSRCG